MMCLRSKRRPATWLPRSHWEATPNSLQPMARAWFSSTSIIRARWWPSIPRSSKSKPTGRSRRRKTVRAWPSTANTGKVVADVTIGGGPDAAGFDPETSLAFSSNGQDGTLTVVHQDSADKYSVVANVPTQRGARTMALDPKTHNVFLATAQYGPPPAATPERPNPRPAMLPNSFVILVFGK